MRSLIVPRSLGRFRTCDVAFQYRAGAGFPGDVSRGHPASIQPCLIDPNAPPTQFGQPVVVDAVTQGVRPIVAGDIALTDIWGVAVRPYPFQQSTTANNYGAVPTGQAGVANLQPIDVLTGGYILVLVNTATAAAVAKGGAVFIWCGAAGGGHTVGGFEGQASGGNTMALSTGRYKWNSPVDGSNVAELGINF
jgi:hypothetical protein